MTVLLIDGDVLAYHSASAGQHPVGNPQPDSFGYCYAFASVSEARAVLESQLAYLRDHLKPTSIRIALSSSTNWRKEIMKDYKSNRAGLEKPILLPEMRNYLRVQYGAETIEGLEADDVIGIWATSLHDPEGRRCHPACGPKYGQCDPKCGPLDCICVGRDKDFKQIPGRHHTLGDRDSKGGPKLTTVTPWQATRWHLIQTLSGDRIDGYAGCPNIGTLRAERIVDNPVRLVPTDGIKTSGKNKGDPVTKWASEPTDDYWACIVSHYRKAGLTEQDALVSARVANILHADQYDHNTGEITLWTPARITI